MSGKDLEKSTAGTPKQKGIGNTSVTPLTPKVGYFTVLSMADKPTPVSTERQPSTSNITNGDKCMSDEGKECASTNSGESANASKSTVAKYTNMSEQRGRGNNDGKAVKVQTGMDRYINVKRKLSPQKTGGKAKLIKVIGSGQPTENINANRFAILSEDETHEQIDGVEGTRSESTAKPPPMFLREHGSSELVKVLTKLIGCNNFHIVPIRKGNIEETKIQIYTEKNYRTVSKHFIDMKKNFYTYQLKSCRGLAVVVKGIDSDVPPNEVKEALEARGFNVRSVSNILNRGKVPQPMFKVDLFPDALRLKANEVHPIYKVDLLLHRRVVVEEPHKRNGPVQCTNCQEYGHTRSYCSLRPVCVVCGDIHQTNECPIKKDEMTSRKCSNCGGNHTANYRGCPIYKALKEKLTERKTVLRQSGNNTHQQLFVNQTTVQNPTIPGVSYASVAQNGLNLPPPQGGVDTNITMLVQTMSQFMSSMQNMLQEIIRTQQQLLQALLSRK